MREIFKDILNTDGVTGVMLFAADGDVLFKEFSTTVKAAPENLDWRFLIESMD